jgi:hypothetical protein
MFERIGLGNETASNSVIEIDGALIFFDVAIGLSENRKEHKGAALNYGGNNVFLELT